MDLEIQRAGLNGDVSLMERLVELDPALLHARNGKGLTALTLASWGGEAGLVRWLVDRGAVLDQRCNDGCTAVWLASSQGCVPVVSLLVERGADPSIANDQGMTPLMASSTKGHLEVVRWLVGHPSAKATVNQRAPDGMTALLLACGFGHAGVARALLDGGADPTIAHPDGTTPMAIAKQGLDHEGRAAGCRECIAALEVRLSSWYDCPSSTGSCDQLAERSHWGHAGRRPSGPTSCGRPGRWPTSRGPTRWRWWGCRRGRRGGRWRTLRSTA
jgi:ankyrin repeat protein